MEYRVNPMMLQLARESRGLSQTEVARGINISQSKLSKAEKGLQPLTNGDFENLVTLLGYPNSFYTRNFQNGTISHSYYRRKMSIPKKLLTQFESIVRIYQKAIDDLLDVIELPSNELSSFNQLHTSPEKAALLVRNRLGVPKGPLPDIVSLLESQGIVILKADLLSDKIDALSTVSPHNHRIIFVNRNMPTDRQRFSISHELGHLLMHFDHIPEDPEKVETQANRFASEFLMPKKEIYDSLRHLNFPKLGDLKRSWGVSMRSIVKRAKALGVINKHQYRNFQINFSKKGFTKNEPITLKDEPPKLLNEVIRLHVQELGYSIDDIASMVSLSRVEFRSKFLIEPKTKLRVVI